MFIGGALVIRAPATRAGVPVLANTGSDADVVTSFNDVWTTVLLRTVSNEINTSIYSTTTEPMAISGIPMQRAISPVPTTLGTTSNPFEYV